LQAIWRLAAKLDNTIPYDERYICRAIGAKRIPLGSLLAAKWVESGTLDELKRLSNAEKRAAKRKNRASGSVAKRKQSATPEKEIRERKTPYPLFEGKNGTRLICRVATCGLPFKTELRRLEHERNVHDIRTSEAV
jgi:hypothetical protein